MIMPTLASLTILIIMSYEYMQIIPNRPALLDNLRLVLELEPHFGYLS